MPWGRHWGGVPVSHNALQHYPECHGAFTGGTLPGQDGGYPARSGRGEYPVRVPPSRVPPPGQVRMGDTQAGYPPSQVRTGGTQVGYPLAGYPQAWMGGTHVGYPPPSRVPPARSGRGGTQLGQQGGRYASCVHVGGLSCMLRILLTT